MFVLMEKFPEHESRKLIPIRDYSLLCNSIFYFMIVGGRGMKNMKHLLICTRLYGNWNNLSNEFIPWANMTGAKTMKQIKNTGERAYSYAHTTVFRLHNQQKISQQKWIICWNIHVCIFVLQEMRVCNIKHASISRNIWIHQTIFSIRPGQRLRRTTTETLVVFQGSRKFPSTWLYLCILRCCSEIQRYPTFSPRNLGLQVRNSRHCAGHSLVEDLRFRPAMLERVLPKRGSANLGISNS